MHSQTAKESQPKVASPDKISESRTPYTLFSSLNLKSLQAYITGGAMAYVSIPLYIETQFALT